MEGQAGVGRAWNRLYHHIFFNIRFNIMHKVEEKTVAIFRDKADNVATSATWRPLQWGQYLVVTDLSQIILISVT